MELNFTKKNQKWEAEFDATGDFNIHIEGVNDNNVMVYQRTSPSGNYALVRASQLYPSYGKVYDVDFTGVVYPKSIMVSCATEPAVGIVTFNE